MKTITNILLVSLLLISCDESPEPGSIQHIQSVTKAVDNLRLLKADETPGDWLSYGRNYEETRFSDIDKINKSNVNQLGLVWSSNLETKRGIESTPLVVDGIMYVTGPWSIVYAIDARSGKLIWKYDPKVPKEIGKKACCDVVNRGVALYKGMVYLGTLDGRLIAIDAALGQPKWEILTVDTTYSYTITGAPRVVNEKVIIGNGGAEYGVRGYVTAYDAITGEQEWRFYTVPGDPSKPFEPKAMEDAAKTWTGDWWKYGGGGTVWDAMAYDPELNQLYIGVGNGAPWNRLHRSPDGGDNLYLSSIVALNPNDGHLIWHYQTTPGDTWDYTATQHLLLADLTMDGEVRKVIMQAPKNGFFYVIDRTNGKLISAENYVYVNWATHIDKKTGRPVETSFSRYAIRDAEIFPSFFGGHSWQPMAFNPNTGLVYIPALEVSHTFGHDSSWVFKPNEWNVAIGRNPDKEAVRDTLAPRPIPQGKLIAWDPVEQSEVWRVQYESAWNGGVLATGSGLVFQGTAEGMFSAYDAEDGALLWEFDLGTGIIAPPISFEVDGEQYLSVAVGWGGARGLSNQYTEYIYPGTVYTFGLNGNAAMPEYPKPATKILANFEYDDDENLQIKGASLYAEHCSHCHGRVARGTGGILPDLGYINEATLSILNEIVLNGAFLTKGMPNFKQTLSENDVFAIKNYILSIASNRTNEETNGNNK